MVKGERAWPQSHKIAVAGGMQNSMYKYGKVGFDPGHYAGANAGPGSYREGDVMLQLGLMLRSAYDVFLTRTDGNNITLLKRAGLAADAGVDTLISLHTNAPREAVGVVVFYSIKHPKDKVMAEYIGSEIAKAIGLKFRGVATRPSNSNPKTDYYGILRYSDKLGIDHPFIVEHGSHWEMAVNTEEKLTKLVETFGTILQLKPTGDASDHVSDNNAGNTSDSTAGSASGSTAANIAEIRGYVEALNKAEPQIITATQKWIDKAAADKDIYWLLRKTADYVKAHG